MLTGLDTTLYWLRFDCFCVQWLAICEDMVIEREIESLRVYEADFQQQHYDNLLLICVVCLRNRRFSSTTTPLSQHTF